MVWHFHDCKTIKGKGLESLPVGMTCKVQAFPFLAKGILTTFCGLVEPGSDHVHGLESAGKLSDAFCDRTLETDSAWSLAESS